jgi:hypothetical protein
MDSDYYFVSEPLKFYSKIIQPWIVVEKIELRIDKEVSRIISVTQ